MALASPFLLSVSNLRGLLPPPFSLPLTLRDLCFNASDPPLLPIMYFLPQNSVRIFRTNRSSLVQRQYSLLVQGVSRIRALSLSEDGPMLLGTVIRLHDKGSIADAEVRRDVVCFPYVEGCRVLL